MAHVFQCNVFQHNVFQGTCSGGDNEGAGAPPMRGAWLKWWETAKAFEELLADPESKPANLSPDQLRLVRKMRMYEEMLFDASDQEARKIEAKIRQLREKIGAS